nr:transducin beta-like protein 3 [Oncorhynchus nerka]
MLKKPDKLSSQTEFLPFRIRDRDSLVTGRSGLTDVESCSFITWLDLSEGLTFPFSSTDTVLSLDVFKKGSLFVSCAKDKSVRVWRQDPDSGQVCCVAQGCSHANAVGSITCSRMKESFVVSGSQDCTIKVWDLPETMGETDGDMFQLTARVTEKAHDKV